MFFLTLYSSLFLFKSCSSIVIRTFFFYIIWKLLGQFFLFIENHLIITPLDSSGRVSLDKTGACMGVVCTHVSSRLVLHCDMEWKSRRVWIIVLCLLYSLRRHDCLYPQAKYRYLYHLLQFYVNGGAKKAFN